MKKQLIIASILTTLAVAGTAIALQPDNIKADAEPPIVTEVNRQGEQLENHEARITNAENDVEAIQQATSVAPSPNRVSVPAAPKPAPETPQPTPVTVVSFEVVVVDVNRTDCKINYSDGTSMQKIWKEPAGSPAWVTDSSGNNGHWVTAMSRHGYCDQSLIGQVKV